MTDLALVLASPREEKLCTLESDGGVIRLMDVNEFNSINNVLNNPSPSLSCGSQSPVSMDTHGSHESILSQVTVVPSLSIDILQPKEKRSAFSSRASTISESESLKLEETIERLEEVVERLTARGGEPEKEKPSPFEETLSDPDECCGSQEESETDTFPDIIFLPSDHSSTSTVRVTDRSAGSTVSSGVVMASEEDSDYDQTKNPFSPYFRPSSKKPSQPNPFECSSFVTDAFSTSPMVPKLDLQEHYSTSARPSEALNGLSRTPNPFRVEAWADARDVQTARVLPSMDSEESDDECFETVIKEGSHSAPSTQRKLAPCAVSYPQTEAFINLVMGDMNGFMEMETAAKFYPDGCFTVSGGYDPGKTFFKHSEGIKKTFGVHPCFFHSFFKSLERVFFISFFF